MDYISVSMLSHECIDPYDSQLKTSASVSDIWEALNLSRLVLSNEFLGLSVTQHNSEGDLGSAVQDFMLARARVHQIVLETYGMGLEYNAVILVT